MVRGERPGLRRTAPRLLVALVLLLAGSVAADVVLVVAKDSPIVEVSAMDVRRLFTGRSSSMAEQPCAPVLLLEGPVHERFIQERLGRTSADFIKNWQKLVFTGKATLPRQLKTQEEVVEAVSADPQLVGYVDASKISDRVKVVRVLER